MSEDKSATLLTELLKYAQHGVNCSWHRSSSDDSCTCGFRDLLREFAPLPSSEGTVKSQPASPDDRIWELRKTLTVIKDGGSCECDHSDENCYFVVDEYCPSCFAAVALSQDSIVAPVPLKSETTIIHCKECGTDYRGDLVSACPECHPEVLETYAKAALKSETVPTESVCDICGSVNPVWFAANPVWNEIVPERSGFICPICFIARAEKQGYQNTGWQLVPENHDIPVETVPTEAAKSPKLCLNCGRELADMQIRCNRCEEYTTIERNSK